MLAKVKRGAKTPSPRASSCPSRLPHQEVAGFVAAHTPDSLAKAPGRMSPKSAFDGHVAKAPEKVADGTSSQRWPVSRLHHFVDGTLRGSERHCGTHFSSTMTCGEFHSSDDDCDAGAAPSRLSLEFHDEEELQKTLEKYIAQASSSYDEHCIPPKAPHISVHVQLHKFHGF